MCVNSLILFVYSHTFVKKHCFISYLITSEINQSIPTNVALIIVLLLSVSNILSMQTFNEIQKLLGKTNGKVVGDLMTSAPLVVRENTNLEDAARYFEILFYLIKDIFDLSFPFNLNFGEEENTV